jgi:hypothetical protein
MNQEDKNKIADELRRQGLTTVEAVIVGWDGPLEVVQQSELNNMTGAGYWTVLATYEADIPSWDYRTIDHGLSVVGEPSADPYRAPAVREQKFPPFPLRRRFFVVGKTRDKLMEELRAKATENYASAHRAEMELAAAHDVGRKLDKQIAEAHEHCVERDLELAGSKATMQAQKDAIEKMERDLAKVRDAIGGRAWKEIVG